MAINYPLLKIQTAVHKAWQRVRWEWATHFKTGDAQKDALAEQAALSILDSAPDMFILRTSIYLLRWNIMSTDQILSFALRGHIQNQLTECDPTTQRLFERIIKHPYPLRLLVSLIYTKRIIPDYRLQWIRQTDPEWSKFIQDAVNEPANIIVKQTI